MSTATLLPTTTTVDPAIAAAAKATQKRRRITEGDEDYQRLHSQTVKRLDRAIRRLMRMLRSGESETTAQSVFIHTATDILRSAYEESHREGQRDYWHSVSNKKRVPLTAVDEHTTAKRLTYFAAASLTKMAREATTAWAHARHQRALSEHYHLDDGDALDDWYNGNVGARVGLQADIGWSGLQDGYAAAGGNDVANPYSELWWVLGPVKTDHCPTCVLLAGHSPYDPPWAGAGSNQLNQSPGDGQTECGANCKCDLVYGGQVSDAALQQWVQIGVGIGMQGMPYPSSDDAANAAAAAAEMSAKTLDALDDFRAAWSDWGDVQGDLPDAPRIFDVDAMNTFLDGVDFDALTDEQREVVERMVQAIIDLGEAQGYGDDPEAADELADQFAEHGDDALRLYSPDQPRDAHGRFAPGGAGRQRGGSGGRGSGAGGAEGEGESAGSSGRTSGRGGGAGGTTRAPRQPHAPRQPRQQAQPRGVAESEKADGAAVRLENHQWNGDEALRPPFSARQFERATLTPATPNSSNDTYTATLGGKKYLFKEIVDYRARSDATLASRTWYETHAEAASVAVARELGMGSHTVDTYAFEHDGKQYVAVRWQEGMKSVMEQSAGMDDGGVRMLGLHASEETLRAMTLHDYIVGEQDRHMGNYLLNRRTGQVYDIDHEGAFRSESANAVGHSWDGSFRAWQEHIGIALHLPQGSRIDNSSLHFDRGQLQHIVSRETQVLGIMREYHLDAGIAGVQKRFAVLRKLAEESDPTVAQWYDISRQ